MNLLGIIGALLVLLAILGFLGVIATTLVLELVILLVGLALIYAGTRGSRL